MRRLLATTRCDVELQARNGLYHATGFVLLITIAALAALPAHGLARLLPAMALNTLAITAFYFSAALALLEASEGSATARTVTPLRPGEYLGARVITLALLGVTQHLALGLVLMQKAECRVPNAEVALPTPLLCAGPGAPGVLPALAAGVGLLALGVALAAGILALAGFALATGKGSLSAMLLPSVPWLGLLLAPLLADVLEWRHPLLWLHPLAGPLALMRAAVAPAAPWEVALGLVLGLAWAGAAAAVALRAYRRATELL